jgi:hypothetical protein
LPCGIMAVEFPKRLWSILSFALFKQRKVGLDHGTGHLASMNSQKNQHINDGKG